MKRVLVVSPRQWDLQWGQEKDLVNALNDSYECVVLELLDYDNLPSVYLAPKNTTVVMRKTRLRPGIRLGLLSELRNLRDIMKYKGDVLVSYLTTGCVLGTLCAKLMGKKILLVYSDDLPELARKVSWLAYCFTKYVANPLCYLCADKVVATSQLLADDIGRRAVVISNGVNLDSYKVTGKSEYIKKDRFSVVYAGSFGDWVDFDLLLYSARHLSDVDFVLAGDGTQYKEMCKKARKYNNVFVPGMLPKEDVVNLINDASVCVIPFKVNRLTDRVSPIKLFEYWAMRKPVICTDFAEVKRIGSGSIFFANNKKEFLRGLIFLRNEKGVRDYLGSFGYYKVKKDFDWKVLGREYKKIVEELN